MTSCVISGIIFLVLFISGIILCYFIGGYNGLALLFLLGGLAMGTLILGPFITWLVVNIKEIRKNKAIPETPKKPG